jgi:hypothetical protein
MNGTAFLVLGVTCLVAALGKLLPAYGGARLGGLRRGDAAVVAALVNTHGLTELIATARRPPAVACRSSQRCHPAPWNSG